MDKNYNPKIRATTLPYAGVNQIRFKGSELLLSAIQMAPLALLL